jgi:3-hydroxyacyl-CoA dehydrogenase
LSLSGVTPPAGDSFRADYRLVAEMVESGSRVLDVGCGDGDLLQGALTFARRVITEKLGRARVRDLKLDLTNAEAYLQFARNMVKAAAGPYPAPLACVEAVAAAVERPFEAGLKRERELFATLMLSPESAALRHIFQAERAASHILDVPNDTPVRPIAKVGVIGAGTMGGGITMSLINAGLPVVLMETSREALDRGLANIRRNYQGALRKGTLTEASLGERLALITPTLDYALLRDVDLVIEAVFESMDVKRQVFETLDDVIRPGAILASNTSYLSIDEIAQATSRPGDVLGMHFFSPANVMKLCEIVRAEKTAPDALATAVSIARKIAKVPAVVGVCDGFVGNRMLAQRGKQSEKLLFEGALPQQVDAVVTKFGMPMGPFAMGDLAGLDIGWRSRKDRGLKSEIADALCEAGRFGQKTGKGYYKYEGGSRSPMPDPEVEKLIAETLQRLGRKTRVVSDDEILERMMYPMINEGARILEEGIAARPSDIDVIWLYGYGWPIYRGGPMFYADQVGLKHIADRLSYYARETNDPSLEPAPLLKRLAAEGKTFASLAQSKAA